jgi:hypothetical protein
MKPIDHYAALCSFARAPHRRQKAWSPEDAIHIMRTVYEVGFDDDRHWGPIFLKAMKDGVIRHEGLFPRESSNGSLRPGWIGC